MALSITNARAINDVLTALLGIRGEHLPTIDHDKARELAMNLVTKTSTVLQGAGLRPSDVENAWPIAPGAMNQLINASVHTYTAETPDREIRFGPRLDIDPVRAYAQQHGLQLMETSHEVSDSDLVADYTPEAEPGQDADQ